MQRGRGIFFVKTLLDVSVGDELWWLDKDDILASYNISRTFLSFIRILSFVRTQFMAPLKYLDFVSYIVDESRIDHVCSWCSEIGLWRGDCIAFLYEAPAAILCKV